MAVSFDPKQKANDYGTSILYFHRYKHVAVSFDPKQKANDYGTSILYFLQWKSEPLFHIKLSVGIRLHSY